MKIKALRNTQLGGKLLLAGKTYDNIADADARHLIQLNKAEQVEERSGRSGGAGSSSGGAAGGSGGDGGGGAGSENPPTA